MQINALIRKIKPKAIIVTLEGHAWERIAFAAARLEIPNIKCIGYQKSAIFRLQHAIKRSLTQIYNPDHILASGTAGKIQLETSYKFSGIPISILGSNRIFIAPTRNDQDKNIVFEKQLEKRSCLVLPEGINSECDLLFEFSLNCAKICPEIQFIWRLHPSVNFKALIYQNPKLKNIPSNIILSQKSIGSDISECSWALYRGTTAIIMAIQAGLRPIYLQVPNEMTIDPLYEIDKWKLQVSTIFEFKNMINSQNELNKNILQNNKDILKDYCDNFFLPFNPQILPSSIL